MYSYIMILKKDRGSLKIVIKSFYTATKPSYTCFKLRLKHQGQSSVADLFVSYCYDWFDNDSLAELPGFFNWLQNKHIVFEETRKNPLVTNSFGGTRQSYISSVEKFFFLSLWTFDINRDTNSTQAMARCHMTSHANISRNNHVKEVRWERQKRYNVSMRSVHQSINQLINQSINQPISQI